MTHPLTAKDFAQSFYEAQRKKNTRAQRDLLLPKLISGEIDVSAFPEPVAVAA